MERAAKYQNLLLQLSLYEIAYINNYKIMLYYLHATYPSYETLHFESWVLPQARTNRGVTCNFSNGWQLRTSSYELALALS